MNYIIKIELKTSDDFKTQYAKSTMIHNHETFRPVGTPEKATLFSSEADAKAWAKYLNKENSFGLLKFSVITLDAQTHIRYNSINNNEDNHMELSTQQQLFYDKITNLDFHKLLLTGEGGTGKTYVLTKALECLIEAGINVLVCAPTHMARMTLLDKFSPEVRHRVQNKTVASALKRFGFKTGDGSTAFTRGKGEFLDQYDVIAVDEVSMMSQRDLNYFLNSKAKIICTGDPQQLPVVKQKKADLRVFANNPEFEHIHLDEQMRQCGAIYALALKSRERIYVPQPEDMDSEAGLYMVESSDVLVDKFISEIKDSHDGTEYHVWNYRYLCYTNEECVEVNSRSREALYPGIDDPYIAGEHLLLCETCEVGYNAEVVKVTNVVQHDLPAWNTSYYEVFANDSVIRTFDQPTWDRIEAQIKDMRSQLTQLRNEKRYDQVKSYTDQIAYIENNFTRVAYPYATTIHKCQGQTIDHVYLNTISIDKATNKRALMYVGISRASSTLTVVQVPLREWQAQRQCNAHYKEGRGMYENVYNEKYYKLRDRVKYPCKTLEEKWLWGWMFKAHAMIPIAAHAIEMIPYNK